MKLSFCPFCAYVGGGEQPVIPQSHHHSALQCQLQMWEVWPLYLPRPCTTTRKFALGSPPGSPPESQTASPAAVEAIAAAEALPRPPPKRMARLLPLIPRTRVPLLLPNHHHVAADGRPSTTTSPTRTRAGRKRR